MKRSLFLFLPLLIISCAQPVQEEANVSGKFLADPPNYFYGLEVIPEENTVKFYVPTKWNSTKSLNSQMDQMDWSFFWSAPYQIEKGNMLVGSEDPEIDSFIIRVSDGTLEVGCADLKNRFVGGNTIDFCKTQKVVFVQ